MNEKKTRLFIILILIISILLSSLYGLLKMYSLNYHLDFLFYMEFASKLFDNALINNYSIYPNGFNLFGYSGLDGLNNFQLTLHFEPITYLYAITYNIFKTPFSIFLLRSILYFFPVLFIALFYPINDNFDKLFLILFSIMWLTFPSTIPAINHDLRPFTLIAPYFLLLVFSIVNNRNFSEILVFFNILFLIREEAILFSFISILLFMSKSKIYLRKPKVVIFFSNWIFWLIIYYFYYYWTDYNIAPGILSTIFSININPVLNFFLLILIAVSVFLLIVFLIYKLTGINISKNTNILYLISFIPPLYYILGAEISNILFSPIQRLKIIFFQFIFDPRYHLLFVLAIMYLLLIFNKSNKRFLRILILYTFGLLIVLCLTINCITYKSTLNYMNERARYSLPIFTFKNSINNTDSSVFVDKTTGLAFFGFQDLFFLHNYYLNGSINENQINAEALENIISNEIQYIVVTKKNFSKLKPIIDKLDRTVKYILENNLYVVLNIK